MTIPAHVHGGRQTTLRKLDRSCERQSIIWPSAVLAFYQMYGSLDEMKRFGIPDPDDSEARLLASVLNRNDVAWSHVAAHARKPCATFANAGRDYLFTEGLPSFVSAVYGYDEACIFSKLAALFHRGSAEGAPSSSYTSISMREILNRLA